MKANLISVKEDIVIDNIVNYLTENIKKSPAILISRSTINFSRIAEKTFTKIMVNYPSLHVSFEAPEFNSNEVYLKQEIESHFLRDTVVVIFANHNNPYNILNEVKTYLSYLVSLTSKLYAPKPKCLIIINNMKENVQLLEFLHVAWIHKFLDITVIEFLQNSLEEKNGVFKNITAVNAIVHSYNPFIKIYYKIEFSKVKQLFNDKLTNMNGYPLYTGFKRGSYWLLVQDNYKGDSILNMITGVDKLVSQILSKIMNFSIIVKIPNIELRDYNNTEWLVSVTKPYMML